MSKKVYLGMSGGVDSSVAAYLLKNEGYEVVGVTLNMWKIDEDAKKVADYLGIEHVYVDKREAFRERVIGQFIHTYKIGRTPNPCVFCNETFKWFFLITEAEKGRGDFISTGHYCGIDRLKDGTYALRRPKDFSKDQTYFLYTLPQGILKYTLFPLSNYSKEEVRDIAKKAGIPVHEKKDSQDICFIPDGDYVSFLEREADMSHMVPGDFVDKDGNVLGRHSGLYRYTIGQRKNLGIALGERMYVKALDIAKNQVVLSKDEDLYESELVACGVHNRLGLDEPFPSEKIYIGRIRSSHKGTPCRITGTASVKVDFLEPVRAIAPGQSIVFYDGDYVAGGGIIWPKDEWHLD